MADGQLDPETMTEEVYEYIMGLDIMSPKVAREESIDFLDGLTNMLQDFSRVMHQEAEQANIEAADAELDDDDMEEDDG